ncbi:cation diffusion facilitator family transporter [Bradyrhizobium sp.]|uniref:cation diffusion facilitator family transporter n=1 Tax=Bradyrhizobium sp. TaxID=376 RepID=UPI001DCA6F41|nr:cation diffusion facilitator family transporter [Bradyrhizobium sp.]MBI5319967.1 cation transporter [Bradyrhizobium sp.]
MAHSHHGHDHSGGHAHAPADFGRAFAVGIALNSAFIVAELVFGWLGNSTALIADAGHNLSDVLGLFVAWGAASLSKRAPDGRFTYGFRGSSILAALFNAVFLLVAVGAIGWESVLRFFNPEPVSGMTVMVVAGIGIVINAATAMMFAKGRKSDINIEGAFLHMAADAAVSLGVVIAAGLILWTGQMWIDPLMSLLICAVIFWSTYGLLRSSVSMSLDAVPAGISAEAVKEFLRKQPGVTQVHDLHIWPISTTETALTCHVVMPAGHPGDRFLIETAHRLAHDFSIGHATLQIEISEDTRCALAPDEVV